MNVASWSAWRLLVVSAGWVLFMVVTSVAIVGVRLWQARDRAPRGVKESWIRSNFAIPLSASARRRLGAMFFVPPLALTMMWLWHRFSSH